jgi:hypothetical protein
MTQKEAKEYFFALREVAKTKGDTVLVRFPNSPKDEWTNIDSINAETITNFKILTFKIVSGRSDNPNN